MLWPNTVPPGLTRLLLVTLGLTLTSRLQLVLLEEPRLTTRFIRCISAAESCYYPGRPVQLLIT